eukprot:183975-Pelagomonas_calceolata.AAC.7
MAHSDILLVHGPQITKKYPIGAIGGPEWRLGGQSVGFTPRPVMQVGRELLDISSSALDRPHFGPELDYSKSRPTYSRNTWKVPPFQAPVAPLCYFGL